MVLGLDDGEQDSNDPASIQGGYLSFLQLRHLRIRDLQRTVSVSNLIHNITLVVNVIYCTIWVISILELCFLCSVLVF